MLKNACIVILSLSLTLLLMEGSAYLHHITQGNILPAIKDTFASTEDKMYKFDLEFGYVLKPNFKSDEVEINSLGIRSSQEFDFDSGDSGSILVLGDSFTFGLGVSQESIFTELLNKASPHSKYVNTGVSGYNTIQEYLVWKKFNSLMRPKLVFLLYMQSNDMWWNARSDGFSPSVEIIDNVLVFHDAKQTIKRSFYKKSFLYRFLDYKFLRGRDLTFLINKLDFFVNGEKSYPWVITKTILEDLGRHSRGKFFQVVIIDIPTQRQVKKLSLDLKRQEFLRKTALDQGFIYVDLLNHYPKDSQKLFLPNDSHWSIEGHKFIADLIIKINKENGLNN